MSDHSIVFIGDSITELWPLNRPSHFLEQGFVCRGVGGETSGQVRGRMGSAIEETSASGVHLLCGINDIAENEGPVSDDVIQENFDAMLTFAKSLGLKIWVGSITPSDNIPWNQHLRPKPRIQRVNELLRRSCERYGAVYIDYYSVLVTETGGLRPDCGTDGLHLNPTGYHAMEATLLEALVGVAQRSG